MAAKRGSMSRKSPTQVELETQNKKLEAENESLRKKLKRAVKRLKQHEDIRTDIQDVLDAETEAAFEELLKPAQDTCLDDVIVVTLPNGQTKQIKKRTVS